MYLIILKIPSVNTKNLSTPNWLIAQKKFYFFFELFIREVILEIFLDAVFLLTTPVFTTFINWEWNFGRNFLASTFFPASRYIDICLIADLYLLFLILFTVVCNFALFTRLMADLVFGMKLLILYLFDQYGSIPN